MKLKTCYYCGTKYAEEEACCPLCGQTEIEPEAIDEVPAEIPVQETFPDMGDPEKPIRPKKEKKKKAAGKQNAASVIICLVLVLIVLGGVAFILNTLGIFSFGETTPAPAPDDPSVNLPVTPVVQDVPCTDLTVSPAAVELTSQGIKTYLAVTLTPAETTDKVSYASSDETVATVSENGAVTAVNPGTATVTVTCGAVSKAVEVTCAFEAEPVTPSVDVDPAGLSLSMEDFSLFEAGETATIRVDGLPEGAEDAVKWESEDPSIATVEDGKVTAISAGTVDVTATVGETKLTCIVRCKLPEGVVLDTTVETGNYELSHDDVTLFTPGETFTLRLRDETGLKQDASWSTSNPNVCTVNSDGVVTAVGSGTAKIIGAYDGATYTCIVRCNLTQA